MEQYALFLVLLQLLTRDSEEFNYTFNDMDSNAQNQVGIYIKTGDVPKYRNIANGIYYNNVDRVQFLVQGGLTQDSLIKTLQLNDFIKRTMITTYNRYINAGQELCLVDGVIKEREIESSNLDEGSETEESSVEDVEVLISKIDLLGGPVTLGKSEQGLPRYSINFRINYSIGGR